jgi:LuxR family maltose regulon positive regulatory protein
MRIRSVASLSKNPMSSPLLTTKLHIPAPRLDWVSRPHLVERLDEARQARRLVLLSAPAGYGKTALLSEWIHQSGIRSAWVSLDEGDNDVARFLAYLVAALQTVEPQIGEVWSDVLCAPQLPAADEILTLLLNDVAEIRDHVVLVLDDYHAITARPVHNALAFLLDHLPLRTSPGPQGGQCQGMLLAIATRVDPPLPVSRLRGSAQLVELRAADLRFTRSEIALFFDHVVPGNLGEAEIATLASRTEGWIAGLQMVALSMPGETDVAGFVRSLSGTHRHIADYLADEVLGQRSPDLQNFLLDTSILDRLTGPLCDAVTGGCGGQAILEKLDRDNLFLVPLDGERRWYRYHHLFADLLRVRLEQVRPDQISDLHRRASEWFADEGDLDTAISYAMAAGDPERALDLLDRHAETLWRRGEYATLLKWLDELGDDAVRSRPRLRVHHALTSIMVGEFSSGGVRLQQLESDLGLFAQGPAPHLQPKPATREQSLLKGMIHAGRTYIAYYQRDIPDMIESAQQALACLPESSQLWRAGLAVVLGSAHEHTGNVRAANQAFSEALAAGKATDAGFLSVTAGAHLAINHTLRGQLRGAVRTCQEQLSRKRLAGIPAAGTLHAVWGDVLREWNQMHDARQHVEKGCQLCERGRGVAILGWSYLALARLLFSERDYTGAYRILQRVETLVEPPAWVVAQRTALEARVWLAQDRLEMASRLLEELGPAVDGEFSFLRLQEYIALARLYVAQGVEHADESSLDDAVHVLNHLRRASEAGGWTGSLIQALVPLALAYYLQGETEQGLSTLNRALILAEPEGFIRTFLDEGEPVTRMLRRAVTRKETSDYARQLLSATDTAPAPRVPPLDPLSPREHEVLRLLAEGLSNPEIADRLFITTGTVKVHASNIYSKLGVSGRTQAAAWARELGLL